MVEPSSNKSVKFAEIAASDSEDSVPESESLDRQFNKFQLLDLADTIEIEEEEKAESENEDEDQNDKPDQKLENKPSTSNRSKKNSRRRKGKAGKKKKDEPVNEDEIMSQIGSYRASHADNEKLQQSKDLSYLELLKVDLRHLVPENEVKRMFGKDVLREEAKSRMKHVGAPGTQRSRFTSNIAYDIKVAQMSSIPRMELDELFEVNQTTGNSSNNTNNKKSNQAKNDVIASNLNPKTPVYFKFTHDKSYQTAHNIFLDAAHQGYSDAIIQNVNMFPSHIESLIQLCDMLRVSEDFKAAADMIERALCLFEMGFHPKFNLTSGLCRLSYKRPENRSFFITLFKHIIFTNRRGLRRTPLEYTKLLLSLDPENDPLFASLLIDFYAIRSEEYNYLLDFISRWRHLGKLPNINFSRALTYFMLSKTTKRGKVACQESLKNADENLQVALVRYPNFIITLLDACSAEPDNDLLKSQYFNYSVYTNKYKTVPESVDLLVNLYLQRNLCFWKSRDVLAWLERNVSTMVKKFEQREIIDEGQNVEYWKTFQGPAPRNLLRHIVLSELKVKIPTPAVGSSFLDIDPYPPESIISYRRDNNANDTNQSATSNAATPLGFSTLFLRSMLPFFGTGDSSEPNRNDSAPR